MGELFKQADVRKILYNKFVVIIGDSVQRTAYKDLVRLLTSNALLSVQHLRQKGELSCCGDERVEWTGKTAGKWYREVRQYHTPHYLIRYYFVTRCYNDYVETILLDLAKEPQVDILLMNSCLWDISRYGPTGIKRYKSNLQIIFSRLVDVLPKHTLFIWLTALPVGKKITAPFITPDISFLENILSIEVKEGNFYAIQVAREYDVDILDLHWYFRNQIHRREKDGVHWDHIVHRRITNFILEHVCKAWKILPPSKVYPNRVYQEQSGDESCTPKKRTHHRSLSMPDQYVRHQRPKDLMSLDHNNKKLNSSKVKHQHPKDLISSSHNNNNIDVSKLKPQCPKDLMSLDHNNKKLNSSKIKHQRPKDLISSSHNNNNMDISELKPLHPKDLMSLGSNNNNIDCSKVKHQCPKDLMSLDHNNKKLNSSKIKHQRPKDLISSSHNNNNMDIAELKSLHPKDLMSLGSNNNNIDCSKIKHQCPKDLMSIDNNSKLDCSKIKQQGVRELMSLGNNSSDLGFSNMKQQGPRELMSLSTNNNTFDCSNRNSMTVEQMCQGFDSSAEQYNSIVSSAFDQYAWPLNQTEFQGPVRSSYSHFPTDR